MMNFGDLFDSIDSRLTPDVARIIEETPAGTRRTVTSADYLITVAAAVKARLVHVNVNYRYEHEELRYILDNCDARCVVFDSTFWV
jgi:fatty-acyl-CoA synthase